MDTFDRSPFPTGKVPEKTYNVDSFSVVIITEDLGIVIKMIEIQRIPSLSIHIMVEEFLQALIRYLYIKLAFIYTVQKLIK